MVKMIFTGLFSYYYFIFTGTCSNSPLVIPISDASRWTNCLEHKCSLFIGCLFSLALLYIGILFVRNFSDYHVLGCALCVAFSSTMYQKKKKKKEKRDEERQFSRQW